MVNKDYKLIVVQGVKGGVGNTTVTVNLAVSLTKIGYKVVTIDLCKNNDLRLHFGMGLDRVDGLHKGLIYGKPWQDYAFEDKNNTIFFPFGNFSQDNLSRIETLLPRYIHNILDQIDFENEDTIVLIDFPSYLSVTESYIELDYDAKVNVGTSEVSCYSKFLKLTKEQQDKELYIINRYNPERKLESDIRTLIASEFDRSQFLGVIFEDEFIHQALAQNTSLVDLNEYFKSAKDFYHLAMKISALLFSPDQV